MQFVVQMVEILVAGFVAVAIVLGAFGGVIALVLWVERHDENEKGPRMKRLSCVLFGCDWFPALVRQESTILRCIRCGSTREVEGQVRGPVR